MDYPEGPTDLAQVNSNEYGAELIGMNDLGTVHLHGPFGNLDSEVKIAYVIGMHPLINSCANNWPSSLPSDSLSLSKTLMLYSQ